MTTADWGRVRDLFEALMDLDPAAADRELAVRCEGDPALREEVQSLLRHHRDSAGFLDVPLDVGRALADTTYPPGARLGTYEVVRLLGHGGMGQAYLARDTRLQRDVCLKSVRPDLAARPGARERLTREAQLAASVNHPGICAVYALEELDDTLFLVTEFIDGHPLSDEMRSATPPSAAVVADTLRQLAEALAAAHARGITHRDLKPGNVMRRADGRVKLLDFGIAKAAAPDTNDAPGVTTPGMLVGTPAYMAPEQVTGGAVDARADVFALGILIYEFATGTHPFLADTPMATAARILEREAEPLARRRTDLATAVTSVVDRCLRKRAEERFASGGDIVEALSTIGARAPARPVGRTWWHVHQWVVYGLYLLACLATFQTMIWDGSTLSRAVFLVVGLVATIAGVIRGHLLFTEQYHPHQFEAERRRTMPIARRLDVALAGGLIASAVLTSADHPLAAFFAIGLAAGIAVTAWIIEPATSAATFGR